MLGPLLFLLYINDLHNAIKYSHVHHFADDTNLLHFNNSLKNLAKKINLDLKFLYSWLKANKISLNSQKTEYIIFKHPRKIMDYNMKLKINGTKLYPSNCIKYLGIWIDNDLSWRSHISDTVVKLEMANGALAKLRHYVSKKLLTLVYYAIFQFHLQYCCQIWGQPTNFMIAKIYSLQNCAIRLISFASQRTSAIPFFSELGTVKFCDIVHCQNIIFLHKLLNNNLPISICDTYSIDFTHIYQTRNATNGLFNLPSILSTSFGKNYIRYQSLCSWNKAISQCHHICFISMTTGQLKHFLKTFFVTSYYI